MQRRGKLRIGVLAGEASGDILGSRVLAALRGHCDALVIEGIGGPLMEAEGLQSMYPMERLSVMGFVEPLRRLPELLRIRRAVYHHFCDNPPDLFLGIDAPDFNLRLEQKLRRAGVTTAHLVSPSVWAWRQGRVKKIAAVVDHLAAIFPFEPEFYKNEDIKVDYVGNPLLDEFKISTSREDYLKQNRLDPDRKTVGLFPGSRKNELKYIFPTIIESACLLSEKDPDLQFLLPVASTLSKEAIRKELAEEPFKPALVNDSLYDVANACDAVITVSGTATLQTALAGAPMAILYKMNPISFAIGKRLVKVPFIGLANIVAGQQVAKEFIQDEAVPVDIVAEIEKILHDDAYRQKIREKLGTVQAKMGEPGCSERVAKIASRLSRGEE
jgi:lipid-A-disaccharide synthase